MNAPEIDEYTDAIEHLSTRSRHFSGLIERILETLKETVAISPEIQTYLPTELRERYVHNTICLGNEMEELSEAVQMDIYSHMKMMNAVSGLIIYQQGEYEKLFKDWTDNYIPPTTPKEIL